MTQELLEINRRVTNIVSNILIHILQRQEERNRQRRQRRWWTRPWILRRPILGQYESLMPELRREDPQTFKNYVREDPHLYDELLLRLQPRLQKKGTHWREPIEPGLRLALTLRFLATGESYHSIAYDFLVAHNTISGIVIQVCDAIVEEYMDEIETPP